MKKRVSLSATITLILITIALTVSVTMVVSMNIFNSRINALTERSSMFESLSDLDQKVRQNYYQEIDEKKLFGKLASGYMEGLDDPHSYYLSSDDYKSYTENMSGSKAGVGMDVVEHPDTKNIYVSEVFKDSPAEEAGIKKGDQIVSINGVKVTELGFKESVESFGGDQGTSAKLEVLRGEETLNIEVTRGTVKSQSVFSNVIDDIGYIKITEFNDTTAQQFLAAIEELESKNVLSYIFDVRNNLGGSLDSVQKIIDRLVPTGTIVSSEDKDGNVETMYVSDAQELSKPMMVLVNDRSASAAELFACDLRDFEKAKLVGIQTYGKGTMQKMYVLEDGGAVNVTVAKFLPYKSPNFHGEGLKPDYEIQLSDEQKKRFHMLTQEEDPQLQKAISLLNMDEA